MTAARSHLPALRARIAVFAILGLIGSPVFGQTGTATTTALKKLSLEELMEIEVTTVSRRPEKLRETAAAVHVITGEDIRRAGAASIPQALRLATALQTAQVGSNSWTIAARGFNSTTATSNKLLVMIDGRSVYSPLFSGTFWDTQDVFFDDVDRIEVVSGPGGATWGANAVNGVINLVTRSAKDTQGTVLYGGAGTEERGFAGLRHGGQIGSGHYRVYAKHFDIESTVRPNGIDARDRWVLTQAGFRTDWEQPQGGHLTVQGDGYTSWIAQPTAPRGELKGGNLLGRWTQKLLHAGEIRIQGYFDTARRSAPNTFGDRLETLDLDAQHQLPAWGRHEFVWGVNGRISNDHIRNLPTQAFRPAEFTHRLFSSFVQDEIELSPNRLRLTLGAKFENNNYSGSDFLPSVRLAWLLSREQTLWSAISRAVRTPSRFDRDLFTPVNPPFILAGGPKFGAESLVAYELGWRGRLGQGLTSALTAFVHDYDDLRTAELPVPITIGNGLKGKSYGVEWTGEVAVTQQWRWRAGYTLLRKDLRLKPGSRDLNQGRSEISDPKHQAQLGTSIDLGSRVEFDATARWIGAVPTFATNALGRLPAYSELDARLAWRMREDLELALIGHNLLDRRHPEAGAAATRRELERSVSGKVTWRF